MSKLKHGWKKNVSNFVLIKAPHWMVIVDLFGGDKDVINEVEENVVRNEGEGGLSLSLSASVYKVS